MPVSSSIKVFPSASSKVLHGPIFPCRNFYMDPYDMPITANDDTLISKVSSINQGSLFLSTTGTVSVIWLDLYIQVSTGVLCVDTLCTSVSERKTEREEKGIVEEQRKEEEEGRRGSNGGRRWSNGGGRRWNGGGGRRGSSGGEEEEESVYRRDKKQRMSGQHPTVTTNELATSRGGNNERASSILWEQQIDRWVPMVENGWAMTQGNNNDIRSNNDSSIARNG
ncbi:hypothetical protein BHE74_00012367 [Ensete ventricosum]|nr:hypothetical protein BHE74_00012367 [Ensete ventricosum]RZR86769.1 hypothetical protein BHM03_00014023 [Ensete ventricosum]